MKKTNVMIEVSEELYDSVVLPYKKKKSFGRLVVQLLEAYAENDAVYSYINGTMDELDDKVMDGLLSDLNNMSQSLSMMSFLENEMEATLDNGTKTFEEFKENVSEDIDSFNKATNGEFKTNKEKEEGNKKDSSLSEEDIRGIVNESVKDALSEALASILGSQVNPSVIVNQSVSDSISESVVSRVSEASKLSEEENRAEAEESVTFESNVHDVEAISEEDKEEAQDALGSLLGSISY